MSDVGPATAYSLIVSTATNHKNRHLLRRNEDDPEADTVAPPAGREFIPKRRATIRPKIIP